jgi:putative glutamine amidotransferase
MKYRRIISEKKMKIGVTKSETNNGNYPNWIKGEDDIEIIELNYESNNLIDVSDCEGIVLTGGIDICPNDGCEYPNAPENFNKKRDIFESKVLQLALAVVYN